MPNYLIDLLTGDPANNEENHGADELEDAIALAQQFYFDIAGDDIEHVIGVWDASYNLMAIIFAAQVFVPQTKF